MKIIPFYQTCRRHACLKMHKVIIIRPQSLTFTPFLCLCYVKPNSFIWDKKGQNISSGCHWCVSDLGCIHLLNTRKYYENTRKYCHNTCEYWACEYNLRMIIVQTKHWNLPYCCICFNDIVIVHWYSFNCFKAIEPIPLF